MRAAACATAAPPLHLARGASGRPGGRPFVTTRLTHPARNRLPRDFILG